jgi:hypothetical protein
MSTNYSKELAFYQEDSDALQSQENTTLSKLQEIREKYFTAQKLKALAMSALATVGTIGAVSMSEIKPANADNNCQFIGGCNFGGFENLGDLPNPFGGFGGNTPEIKPLFPKEDQLKPIDFNALPSGYWTALPGGVDRSDAVNYCGDSYLDVFVNDLGERSYLACKKSSLFSFSFGPIGINSGQDVKSLGDLCFQKYEYMYGGRLVKANYDRQVGVNQCWGFISN